jgi:hypothetical protein
MLAMHSNRHDRVNGSASRQAGCNAALPAGAAMSLMATVPGRIQKRIVKAATVTAALASPPALVPDCGALTGRRAVSYRPDPVQA